MNLVFMETLYSCQNSFCNPQNMPFGTIMPVILRTCPFGTIMLVIPRTCPIGTIMQL